ncbi:amidohydrolase family protein [Saccharopolyspora antimicrobica]|uniref:amidohydrolase family protein n=1 Tax=Saccharopolyspora antimicrobica TaxID=455193 RepID=UPI001FE30AFA|nr:amidohydrolase family protein [Saccharopolyspora antimicrobica]
MVDLTRRALFAHGGRAAAGFGSAWMLTRLAGEPVAFAEPGAAGTRQVVIREATNAAAAVSPDGRAVVFDLLNMLWVVPMAGGEAVRITDVVQEAGEPDVAPDGRRIVCQSYQDGQFQLALLSLDGSGFNLLTSGSSDHREPRFSPDGTRIAFSGETGGRYGIRVLDPATGRITDWTTGADQEAHPVWFPDGSAIAFTRGVDNAPTAIDAVDAAGNRRTLVEVAEGQLAGPSFAPDGRFAYVHLTTDRSVLVIDGREVSGPDEDVFPFAPRWLSADEVLYTADGKIRRRDLRTGHVQDVPFTAEVSVRPAVERASTRDFDSSAPRPVKGLVGPALSPDGQQVACQALGGIWLLRRDGEPERVVADDNFNGAPAWSPDGRTLVFSSDRNGQLDLWLHDLTTGEQRQLTDLHGDERAPAFSPDGRSVAFLSHDWVCTVELATGAVRKLIGPLNAPGRPCFSADGSKLGLAGFVPVTRRYREGGNQVLTVDVATGAAEYTPALPGRSLVNRVDAGPVYSPDGRSAAFVVSGTAWVSDVDDRARPVGAPRRVSAETADSPSWGGDSRTLLYLSNGRLRIADVRSGAVRSMPTRLTWRPRRPDGEVVIRAGALWDGEHRELRRDVDVLVRGNRIAAVGRGLAAPEVIDARGLTVLPGMVATHEHLPWENNRIPRLWLSFGVTSVRSPGSGHYVAVEAKEAQESGSRLGPRVFAAGEFVDGGRVYYESNRPITNADELRRELERVGELGHDMVKTYVRLPYSRQREAIELAHAGGVPVSSHYLYGPAALGADAVEHTGATSRYGHRHKESQTGRAYADVIDILVRAGMSSTPTLGLAPPATPAVYHFAGWALEDPRLKALLPEDMYAEFRAEVEAAAGRYPEREMRYNARQVATVRRMVAAGGHIAVGTDTPLVPHAIFYHLNLDTMVRNGIDNHDVLRAATAGGARVLGMSEQLGTVAAGKLADLAFVQGDPLTDIKAVAQVRQVLLDGVLHTVEELIGGPAAQPPARPVHTVRTLPAQQEHWWHGAEYTSGHVCC